MTLVEITEEIMKHWWVISPEMAEVVPVLDDGSGPIEYFCDVVSVAAANRREAIRCGVALMQKWPQEARQDGRNPYARVKAEDARCLHGFCWCDLAECERNDHLENRDYCEMCEAEALERDRLEDSMWRMAQEL